MSRACVRGSKSYIRGFGLRLKEHADVASDLERAYENSDYDSENIRMWHQAQKYVSEYSLRLSIKQMCNQTGTCVREFEMDYDSNTVTSADKRRIIFV